MDSTCDPNLPNQHYSCSNSITNSPNLQKSDFCHTNSENISEQEYVCQILEDKQQLFREQFHLIQEKMFNWSFNMEQPYRFSYFIYGRHSVVKKINCFKTVLNNIKNMSGVKAINFYVNQKTPEIKNQSGMIFQIYDQDEVNMYKALLYVFQKLVQIDNCIDPLSQFKLVILVPKMLVPVVIGRNGRLLRKIKDLSMTQILVSCPYPNYNYQNIEITSLTIERVCKACSYIYSVAYKLLKMQPIQIKQQWTIGYNNCKIGILLSKQINKILLQQYSVYFNSLIIDYQIKYQITKHFKFSNNNKISQKNQVILIFIGNVNMLKPFLSSIIQLIWFQKKNERNLCLVINKYQAKSITSFSGIILKDISSKSGYCYMEMYQKDSDYNRLIVKGNSEGKIKASCLVIQYLCYQSKILNKINNVFLSYEKILQQLADKLQPKNESTIHIEHQDSQEGEQKVIKIKKINKSIYKINKYNCQKFRNSWMASKEFQKTY